MCLVLGLPYGGGLGGWVGGWVVWNYCLVGVHPPPSSPTWGWDILGVGGSAPEENFCPFCAFGRVGGCPPRPWTADPGVVKQDKSSRGSVDTTKTRSDPQTPQRVRMSSGQRPIGAAKGKQSDTEALCGTPPTPPPLGHRLTSLCPFGGVLVPSAGLLLTTEHHRGGQTPPLDPAPPLKGALPLCLYGER